MSRYGVLAAQIIQLLETCGPMTRTEICRALGDQREKTGSAVSRLAKASKTIPKRLHIERYVYDQEGQRRYPRAVYAVGDKPDAKKPKPDIAENVRRSRRNIRMRVQYNNVFNLGTGVKALIKRGKSSVANDLASGAPVETA